MTVGSKVWLVTGASSGFGRAIVEEAVDRNEETASDTAF
jgi:NAD(P)-dependent dehydrogenase (short-subunit alcohol dehydrogenase family)